MCAEHVRQLGMLQIHLDSIEEANSDPSQFVPTHKMISHGPGAVMVGPFRFPETVQVPSGYSGTVQPVIIHAILDEKGRVLDAEAVPSSPPHARGRLLLGLYGVPLTRKGCARASCNARPSLT
jgi:hypothetical protein